MTDTEQADELDPTTDPDEEGLTTEQYETVAQRFRTEFRIDLGRRVQKIADTYFVMTRHDPETYYERLMFAQSVAESALLWLIATGRATLKDEHLLPEEEAKKAAHEALVRTGLKAAEVPTQGGFIHRGYL